VQSDWLAAAALSKAAQPRRADRAVCSSEQRAFRTRRTVPFMQFQQANGALAATWILGAGLIGLGDVTSVAGVATVLGVGLVPPMLLMLRWTRPVHAVVHQANP
jgi:hypothetical protein